MGCIYIEYIDSSLWNLIIGLEKYTREYKHGRHCCVYDGASEAKMWLPSFPKNFVQYPLHRIFVHMYVMYVALNVVEKNDWEK